MAKVDLRRCSLAAGAAPLGCDWCGRTLTRRQRRWCSTLCENVFLVNHVWSEARARALRRDGYMCIQCGSPSKLEVNHIVPLGYSVPGKADPYSASCLHHLSGLETLCHDHHVMTTNQQRAEGLIRGGWASVRDVGR